LAWTNTPAGTKSFAVIAFDPDGQKGLGGNIHWVAYDIGSDTTSLAEGEGSKPPTKFIGGMNGRKLNVYFGPCAPATEQPHHYLFSVFALDIPIGQLGPNLTRDELIAKMRGHVLGMGSITARFSRGLY
jgi:Raf kinase inhibitor-like YbhB/YbcL family protein